MGSYRLRVFTPFPGYQVLHNTIGAGTLQIYGVNINGSLSFSNLSFLVSASGTTAKTLTLSFGLYSRNGASLSLANSASRTLNPVVNQLSWYSMATSATQDITPGNWYFAFVSATSSNSRISLAGLTGNAGWGTYSTAPYLGAFLFGNLSVTTAGLPSVIATSDCNKEQSVANTFPLILISA